MKLGPTALSEWTNLAYIVAGIALMLTAHDTGIIVGLAFIGLGVGSWIYHRWYTAKAQLMDERGMYVAFAALVAVAPYEAFGEPWGVFAAAGILAVGLLLAAVAHNPRVATMFTMPAWALVLMGCVWWRVNVATALIVFAGFLVVAVWRELPESNFWTPSAWARENYDAIHGLWHVGTCLLMLLSWMALTGIWRVGG